MLFVHTYIQRKTFRLVLSFGVLVVAIGDESTRDIEELVSKQRDHKPRMNNRRVGFWPRFVSHSFAPVRRGTAPPAVPALLRSQLIQLLSYGPVGLGELEGRYAASFGRPLKVTQYGFYSIMELLGVASDFITVRQSRAGSLLFLKTPDTISQIPAHAGVPPKQFAGKPGVFPSPGNLIHSKVCSWLLHMILSYCRLQGPNSDLLVMIIISPAP